MTPADHLRKSATDLRSRAAECIAARDLQMQWCREKAEQAEALLIQAKEFEAAADRLERKPAKGE